MTKLERMRKELELEQVKVAMKQMDFNIAEREADIERLMQNKENQMKRIKELEEELSSK